MTSSILYQSSAVSAKLASTCRVVIGRLKQLTLGVVAAMMLVSPPGATAAPLTMVDIGNLGGSWNYPNFINNSGQIVGNAATPGDVNSLTYFWDPVTGMHVLPTIGLGGNPASVLNDSGLVLGYFSTSVDQNGNATGTHCYVWSLAAGYHDIGTLGGSYTWATGMNSSGQVIGSSSLAGDAINHGFIWDATNGMRDLGTLGGSWNNPSIINSKGQIAGVAALPGDNDFHAYIWDAVNGLRDITTTNSSIGQPVLMNDAGVVVCTGGGNVWAWDAVQGARLLGRPDSGPMPMLLNFYNPKLTQSGLAVGTYWDMMTGSGSFVVDTTRNTLTALTLAGRSGSNTEGINEAGQVVSSIITASGYNHAFLWDAVNGIQDLGTLPGGTYSVAMGINNRGQVAGYADTASGATHPFLWDAVNGMQDLGTLGGTEASVSLVSDGGFAGISTLAGDQLTHAFYVPPPSVGKPDLQVVSLTATNTRQREGYKVTISITVKNTGTASASATTTSVKDGSVVLGTLATPALAVGQSVILSLTLRTADKNGVHVLTATADSANAFGEKNNTATLTVFIRGNQVRLCLAGREVKEVQAFDSKDDGDERAFKQALSEERD